MRTSLSAMLLCALSVVPQSPFVYEAMPLFFVPRTRPEFYALVLGSVPAVHAAVLLAIAATAGAAPASRRAPGVSAAGIGGLSSREMITLVRTLAADPVPQAVAEGRDEEDALATAETGWCDPGRTWSLSVNGTEAKVEAPVQSQP